MTHKKGTAIVKDSGQGYSSYWEKAKELGATTKWKKHRDIPEDIMVDIINFDKDGHCLIEANNMQWVINVDGLSDINLGYFDQFLVEIDKVINKLDIKQ